MDTSDYKAKGFTTLVLTLYRIVDEVFHRGDLSRLPELRRVVAVTIDRIDRLAHVFGKDVWRPCTARLREWERGLRSDSLKKAEEGIAEVEEDLLAFAEAIAKEVDAAKAAPEFSIAHGDLKAGVPELGLDPVPESTLTYWFNTPGYQKRVILNFPEESPASPRKPPPFIPALLRFSLRALLELQEIRRRQKRGAKSRRSRGES